MACTSQAIFLWVFAQTVPNPKVGNASDSVWFRSVKCDANHDIQQVPMACQAA